MIDWRDHFEPLPEGPFSTVLADPPWGWKSWSGQDLVPHRRKGGSPYKPVPLPILKSLPVADVCAKDAVLHMWVIDSHLEQAMELGRAWGFEFKTRGFDWVKMPDPRRAWLDGHEVKAPRMSFGKWVRKEGEISLIFTRGKPSRSPGGGGVRQTIFAERRGHSQKPEAQYERIQRLSAGPYLELFGRTSRPGWTTWGDQVDKPIS